MTHQCKYKDRLKKGQARARARRLNQLGKNRGRAVQAYYCLICGGWHVGHGRR